jgi:glycosyltransferase involved in cell wall biosynthesis
MLIGIDASRANLKHKAGPEWYSYYIIRFLAKIDDKNEYILYSNKPLCGGLLDLSSEQYFDDQDEKIEVDKKGWQKIKSPHNNFKAKIIKWPFDFLWTQGALSLEMIFNRPDVLFVPAHVLPFIHPKKSILTLHDIGYENTGLEFRESQFGEQYTKLKKFLNFVLILITFGKYKLQTLDYLRWTTEYAIKHAKKIIVPSFYTKHDVEKIYNNKADKIAVVYNGYNKFLYRKINNLDKIKRIKRKYGIEGKYILYIGRIEKKKNIAALIEAFAIFRDHNKNLSHKLVLVGNASLGYDEIKYAIREFDLVDDVIIPGWIKEIDVPFIFAGADAFVFPSLYEGFGLPLLQAMASDLPIAASKRTAIPEIVKDAALFFNPDYAFSIADAIKSVLINQPLRKDLIQKGQQRVKDFSWEKTARETLKIINNI